MPRKKANLTDAQKVQMFDLQQQWQSLADSMKLLEKGSQAYKALKKERDGVTTQMRIIRESGT